MDKIARVRREIERRIEILTNVYAEQVERKDEEMMTYYHGKVIALEELLSFLDTLAEEPDKSLEEAAEEFVWEVMEEDYDGPSELSKKLRPTSKISDFYNALAEFFKRGAEWQKSQMLKDAVEANVNTYELTPGGSSYVEFVADMSAARFKLNDKVRIVVLKAEEK